MEYKVFKLERVEYIVKVVLNRPDKRNAMGPDFWPELLAIFRDLDKDPEVRAIVLCGAGKHFCAGLDLVESIAHFPKGGDGQTFELFTLHNFITEIQESINAIEECNKPVVCAIHGACIGGGLDLAATDPAAVAERTGADFSGPIPLPTEIRKYTVNKSTFVHKKSRDQYEMRIHKRLIDIMNPVAKTIDNLTNLNLPAGVDIEIKMM